MLPTFRVPIRVRLFACSSSWCAPPNTVPQPCPNLQQVALGSPSNPTPLMCNITTDPSYRDSLLPSSLRLSPPLSSVAALSSLTGLTAGRLRWFWLCGPFFACSFFRRSLVSRSLASRSSSSDFWFWSSSFLEHFRRQCVVLSSTSVWIWRV